MGNRGWKEIARSVSWNGQMSDWSDPISFELFDGNSTVAQFRFGPLDFPKKFKHREALGFRAEGPSRWTIRFHEEENNVWLFEPPNCDVSKGPEGHETTLQHLLNALFVLSEALVRHRSESPFLYETGDIFLRYMAEINLSRQSGAYVSGIFLKQENALARIFPKLFCNLGMRRGVRALSGPDGIYWRTVEKGLIFEHRYHLLSDERLDALNALNSDYGSRAFDRQTAILAFLHNDPRVLKARFRGLSISSKVDFLTILRDVGSYRSKWHFWQTWGLRRFALRQASLGVQEVLRSCETDWEKVSDLRRLMDSGPLEQLPLSKAVQRTIDRIFELPDPIEINLSPEQEERQRLTDWCINGELNGEWGKHELLDRWRSR